MIIPVVLQATDIACIHGPDEEDGTTLNIAQHQARDDSIMVHLYGIMNLQLRIGGRHATPEESTQLIERFPLTTHAQRLVSIAEGQGCRRMRMSTLEHSVHGDEERVDPEFDATGEDLGNDADDWEGADRAFFDEGHSLED